MIGCVAVVLLALVSASQAVEKGAPSPFLITEGLPHLTKLLVAQWDNPALKLTPEQREQLLVVRKKTISAVKQITPKVATLRQQVMDGIAVGKTPEELDVMVQELAQLKASATQVHLRCIYDTQKILTSEQLRILKNL